MSDFFNCFDRSFRVIATFLIMGATLSVGVVFEFMNLIECTKN